MRIRHGSGVQNWGRDIGWMAEREAEGEASYSPWGLIKGEARCVLRMMHDRPKNMSSPEMSRQYLITAKTICINTDASSKR